MSSSNRKDESAKCLIKVLYKNWRIFCLHWHKDESHGWAGTGLEDGCSERRGFPSRSKPHYWEC
jgi:hypothetical protein